MNSPASQGSSHRWSAPDVNAAAGAKKPPYAFYYSRYAASDGLVTCGRCHNPHDAVENSKQSRPSTKAESCLECHNDWNLNNNNAWLTHPVGIDYASFAGTPGYKAAVEPTGSLALVGGNMIYCGTCHGAHFVDSDSSTPDVIATTAPGPGDGHLLRSDGPLVIGATAAEQAQKRSNLCQACHTHQLHGTTNPIGCLDCHGGHSYNGGTPNYYILRNATSTSTFGDVTGLSYAILPGAWSDGSTGSAGGYCEKCHGEVTTMVGSARAHSEGETCSTCHAHNGATRSFEAAGGCDGCHGYPPTTNSAGGATGYAAGYTPFKDESQTPHAAHAGGGADYSFACVTCHLNYTHDTGSFQDVFLGSDHALATGNGNMGPTYNPVGSGSCSSVYCHSNGGARTGDATRTYTAASIPAWAAGSTTGAITTCDACHGNTAATMAGLNSARHQQHVSRYACGICHTNTATNSTTLKAGAIGGTHVNNSADVAFDTTGFITVGASPYNTASGVCSVYCHSDGRGNFKSADWDATPVGGCILCHDGKVGDSSIIASGAHAAHVSDPTGPQMLCSACHGAGSDTAVHAGHLNGTKDAPAQSICNGCHGASDGVTTGDDRQPVWTNTATVDCSTCHGGSVLASIGGKTAPDKNNAKTGGHNKASGTYTVSGNVAAGKLCTSCHDSAAIGHFDGSSGDDMRLLAAAATCTTSCHGVGGSAVKDGIITHQGKSCSACHDPHGGNNIYMIKTTSTGNYSGTVAFTAITGADSYDENDAANGDDICATCHTAGNQTNQHNNKTNTGVAHNEGTDCFTCHKTHTESAGAFIAGAGTACNDCHGFPPATAAHAKHAQSGSNDKDLEDRSDCEACHTGAASFTYAPATDRGNSLNHGNVTGRRTILGTSVGYNSTDKNCTTACHNSTLSDGAWNDVNGLDCNACHYYSATPTSAGNVLNGRSEALGGDHGVHFGVGGVVTCSNCHVVPSDSTHISIPSGTDAQKYQDRALAEQDEADVTAAALGTGNDPDVAPFNATCNNAACHNPSGTTYSATWNISSVNCTLCHGDMTTKPTSGSHNQHLSAVGTFGINTIACTSCHVNNGTNNAHRNGTVNVVAGMSYTAGAEDVLGTLGTCTTTTCHNDGKATASAVVTPTWGTASADCTICHGNAPATGEHAKHVANTTYVDGGCNDCHTAANTTTHLNGSRNIGGQITDMDLVTGGAQLTAPGGWNGTCANACHIANTANDWTAGTLVCADCHGSGKVTTPAMDRGWPPSSGAHAAHLGNSAYVTGANCTDCHNNNTTTHSTLNNVVTLATGTKISANPGNGSCTNSCHAAAQASDWTGGSAAVACVDCHAGTYIGGNNVAKGFNATPASGLHAITPSVSGVQHDNSFGAGGTCASCHTSVMAQATHIAGTFTGNGSVAGDRTAMGLAAFYSNGGSDNTGTCATTACHTGNSDDWAHVWTSAANSYTTSPSACDGCHGDSLASAGLGTTGVIHRAVTVKHNAVAGGYTCKDCHALGGAGYTFTFSTNDWGGSSNHGNGSIDINNTGTSYNTSTGYCTSCHTSGAFNFSDTGWAIASVAGDSISTNCGECHANGVKPGSASGAHTIHNAGTAALVAGGAACTSCHGDNSGQGYQNTLAGTHGTGSVNFANVTYSTAIRNDLTGTCLTANCHNGNTGTDQSAAWNATQLACDDCHYYAATTTPTAAGNTAHGRPLSSDHGNHFGTGGSFACADCHGADPAAGDTSHINGVTTLADKAVATQDEANVTVTTWNDTTNSCANAACHNPSGTTYSAIWQTSAASCTLCHNSTNPGTGSHGQHMSAATNFGINTVACTSCHANNGTNNRHRNGSITFAAGMNYTASAEDVLGTLGTCTTTTCHNNGVATPAAVVTPTWGTASADCTLCHANPPATAKHAEHVANTTYVPSSCTSCHTAATAATHINGTRNMDAAKVTYTSGTQTCTNNCHVANTSGDWTAGGALSCADCHNGGGTLHQSGYPPASAKHTKHINNTAYVAGSCSDCHGANAATGAHATHVNGAINNALSYASATQTCTTTCHVASTSGDWTAGGALVCLDCHSGTYIGGNNVAKGFNATAATGLHTGLLTVSGNAHDDSFADGNAGTATCTTCHTTVPSSAHINGTFTNTSPTITITANVGFTDGATPTCGPVSGLATCHDDGGAWKRKWSDTAKLSTGAECANCHGDFTTGFVTGMGARHATSSSGDADGQIASSHDGTDKCYTCHTYKAGSTLYYNFATQHRDGSIQINNGVGFVDNGATVGCSKCHNEADGTADEQHEFADSTARWPRVLQAGPAVSCATCHGYPPTPGDGINGYGPTAEAKGVHGKHVSHIAGLAGVTLNANTDTFTGAASAAVCGVCHDVSSSANHNTAGGTRHLLLNSSYQFGLSAPAYNGTVGVSSSVDPKSCSNIDCHFQGTPVWAPVGGE